MVVVISANDDCSLASDFLSQQIPDHEATAFRCFANSLTCDEAATTIGLHHNCRPNDKPGMHSAKTLIKKLFQLKGGNAKSYSKLHISLVAGDVRGTAIANVVPSRNGGVPALSPGCTSAQATSVVANPSLRLVDFAAQIRNNSATTICDEYFVDALNPIATRFPEWSPRRGYV